MWVPEATTPPKGYENVYYKGFLPCLLLVLKPEYKPMFLILRCFSAIATLGYIS